MFDFLLTLWELAISALKVPQIFTSPIYIYIYISLSFIIILLGREQENPKLAMEDVIQPIFFFLLLHLAAKKISEIKARKFTLQSIIIFIRLLSSWGKLHFATLNNTSDYTLHSKLSKCTFCILNYDHCYTLHININFAVNLDGRI